MQNAFERWRWACGHGLWLIFRPCRNLAKHPANNCNGALILLRRLEKSGNWIFLRVRPYRHSSGFALFLNRVTAASSGMNRPRCGGAVLARSWLFHGIP